MKIALLISGQLGLFVFNQLLDSDYLIEAVFTDVKSVPIIDLAKERNIPIFTGNPRNGKSANLISNISIEVLLSINYLFIIEKDLITWPNKYAINIHGSLLPQYRGRTPHVWAIINNEKYTGITVHLINEGCDTGDICYQKKVTINKKDTGASILKKFRTLYPKMIYEVLENIRTDSLKLVKQDETKFSFFGKRTSEDGQINWDWQKERIYNWIRAQAYPYPGAFTFYNDKKIIVDQAEYDDFGYSYEMKNGLILSIHPLRIKTPNGVLKITSFRESEVEFKSNSTFK